MFHWNNRAIIFDLDGFVGDGGNVVDAFLEKRTHIWCQSLDTESRIIRAKRDLCIWLRRCAFCDLGWTDFVEIVLEFLDIL